MNPLRVWARNYRSHETLDLALPLGATAIVGDNGAGKSSIVNVVELALFGARSLEPYLMEGGEATELELGVEFEHSREVYRVRRSFSARGRGKATLDFEWLAAEGNEGIPPWKPVTRESAQATQAAIEETIGLTRETFRASAFLAQGDGAAFTEAQPRDRKRILAEVLGLQLYDQLLALAQRDRKAAQTELDFLAGRIGQVEAELAERQAVEVEVSTLHAESVFHEATLAEYEETLQDAAARVQEAREQRAEAQTARSAAEAAAAELRRQEQIARRGEEARANVKSAEGEIGLLEPVAAGLGQAEAERAGLDERLRLHETKTAEKRAAQERAASLEKEAARLGDEAKQIRARANALRAQAAELEEHADEAAECDRCGRALDDEARARAILSYTAEADELDPKAIDLVAAADDLGEQAQETIAAADAISIPDKPTDAERLAVATKLQEARTAETQLAARRAQIAAAQSAIAEADASKLDLDRATEAAKIAAAKASRFEAPSDDALQALEREAAAAKLACDAHRQQLDETRSALAVARARIERLDALAEQAAGDTRSRRRAENERDLLILLERAFSRDGIPALIFENSAVPQIEIEATRILEALGRPYRVELQTQRALKSGDGVKDALDFVIHTEAGARVRETFSGGEKARIDLALRIALARLLANRRGAEVRLLAIDEPDGLDAEGFARLAELLKGMGDDFDRILVVSHHPDLREAFDQAITVEKRNGVSQIDAGVAEALVA